MEEELSYCSYGEAYEVNCARYGREADMPIAHFKKRCCSPSGNLISDPNGEIRLQVRVRAGGTLLGVLRAGCVIQAVCGLQLTQVPRWQVCVSASPWHNHS